MNTLQNQVRWCARAQWALGGAAALGLLVFYFAGYRPQMRRLEQLRADISSQQRELQFSQSRAKVLPQVAIEVKNLRLQLDQIRKPSRQTELPQLIKDLTQIAQQAALKKFN